MLDRLHEYVRCFADPQRWAIASVVSVTGSSPVPVGTSMAVSDDLEIIGALSAGCAETAAALSAQQAIERDEAVVEVFSRDGERAGSVNLTCGGAMEVLILPLSRMQDLERARQLTHQDRRHRASLSIDVAELAATVRFARSAAPTLILTGVHDFSQQLAEAAVRAGWWTHVVDIRREFAIPERCPHGAQLHVGHPPFVVRDLISAADSPFTAVCVMTHHPDLDVPVLSEALRSPGVSFVGAMGSRFAAARRDMELAELGHPAASRGRVRSPLGLDIGSQSPAESAISMFAEILGAKNDASDHLGEALSAGSGPVDRRRPRHRSILQPMAAH
ncbi:XdhC family protein [Nesterenkonia sp. NBAIMH1]|uniref:XdhC family protein n=1 Tax=Nesterenkonia sp. NBAIMH1 TaxID=2600320 RepID=UPI0011B5016E|nr:XdhC family protein [Nesterenkonia sp. NBAIMH1]